MSTAKGSFSDSDIHYYSLSSGALGITNSSTELYVPAGHTFAPGGDVNSYAVKIVGTVEGGSNTFTVQSADWDASSGTFNGGTSTVVFTGNTSAFTPGTSSYYNITVQKGGWRDLTINGTATVTNDLYLNGGNSGSDVNSGTINVAGNVTVGANHGSGTTVVRFSGTGAQSVSSSGGYLPSVEVDKSSGTLTLSGTVDVEGDWTHTQGTVDAGTSTLRFVGGVNSTFTPGTVSYYNITSQKGNWRSLSLGGNLVLSNTLTINNGASGSRFDTTTANYSITAGSVAVTAGTFTANASTIYCSGDWTKTGGTFNAGTSTIVFNGSTDSTFTPGASTTYKNITVNKTSQTSVVTLSTDPLTLASSSTLDITSGILDLAGVNLDLGSGGTFSNTGTLRLQGAETLSNFTNDTDSGTVVYNGSSSYSGLIAGNNYYNLAFDNAAGAWTLGANLDVNNDLTITNGTLDVSTSNYSINVAGDFSNSGTFTARSGTVTLDGTLQAISGSTTFYNLTKTVSSADTLTFQAGSTQTIGGTATLQGASGQMLGLRSSVDGTRWNLTLSAGASKSISYVDVKDSDASGSDASLKPINPTNSTDSGNNIDWFPGYRPDAMIKLSSEADTAYLSDDVYESSASVQVKSQGVVSGSTAVYTLKFENDGGATDSLTVTGTGSGSGFTVQYLDETSTDRTSAVTGSGYTISNIGVGSSKVWTLNVTPSGNPSPVAGGTSYEVLVTVTSANDGTKTDQVKAVTSSTSANITLVKSADKSTADPGEEITYTVTATNGSGLTDASNVVVTDSIPADTGFKVGGASFNAGTSTLSAAISYSNDNGSSWTYTPASGGCSAPAGYDYCVTDVRWTMTGSMPTGTNFSIGLVVRIK